MIKIQLVTDLLNTNEKIAHVIVFKDLTTTKKYIYIFLSSYFIGSMITKMLLKYIPKYIGNALDSPTYLIDRHIPFNK